MNQQSSRSHTIFKLVCESRVHPDCLETPEDSTGVLVGQLSLVDLAGSESVKHTGAQDDRLSEAGKINLSLSVLSRVIQTLATRTENSHVSFRDSKLTRLLQTSLDGNSRTAIIACVTPASSFCVGEKRGNEGQAETSSTLKFAQSAKNVHTAAKVNQMLDDKSLIRKLRREIEALKKQIKGEESPMDDAMELEEKRRTEKELSEAQMRLEGLSRDVRDKEVLLQQQSTEKSNVEAELVLTRAREKDLQGKLGEVINRFEEAEKKIKELQGEIAGLRAQNADLAAMLRKAQ